MKTTDVQFSIIRFIFKNIEIYLLISKSSLEETK